MDHSVLLKTRLFFSSYKLLYYKKGETVIRSDDEELNYIFYLQSGYVRQYNLNDSGEEVTMNIFKKYSFFPMIFVMNDTQNTYNFEAMTYAEIRRAPKNDVITFVKNNSGVAYDLAARLGNGLTGMLKIMHSILSDSARNKILTLLYIYSLRFGKQKSSRVQIDITLTHRSIASFTGLARETVSREMKTLEREGLITKANGHFILNDKGKIEEQLLYC